VPCDNKARAGRLAKARQFLEAAEMIDARAHDEADLVDAYVTCACTPG
jgi:hypothetical protein